MEKATILYVGGFQLPDKNAAALRVVANAKALRDLGFNVVFLNALTDINDQETNNIKVIKYYGFTCYEYKREPQRDYLLSCKRIVSAIKKSNANIVIAYNHPAVALNKLRKYCQKNSIKCYADVTEWYIPPKGNPLFFLIKGFDSEFRMRYIHKRMDGVIAISEYLYQYYRRKVKIVKIPPLVDISDEKWSCKEKISHHGVHLIYAGSPSRQKEKLDMIVNTVEEVRGDNDIYLDVVGVTEDQYNKTYGVRYSGTRTKFWGRVSNEEVIRMTIGGDWTVVLRDRNKVVQAGFPTKVSESISCGTPVIANRFSNIDEYLDDCNSILLDSPNSFRDTCRELKQKKNIKRDIFDYRLYLSEFQKLLSE